ncbi:hypothetical protein INS49_008104 [Diaporthe citri]|uniref:uncharacterized protein n=1 Tax=Diaporthe citri TaxID=83186 RepID=UPI001C80EE6E|nr:uncharacterized protein INS49_008104 [Diaporthe citri]KAG6363009.1 hypothetical protein INS49_008104 [Diaporthe citri]
MATEPSNQRTVEFYLSSLWSWLPEGHNRILEALEGCDLEQADFAWDEKYHWFHIRCLEDDKDYVMNQYLKAQSEMEIELKEKDVIRDDGNLIPTVKNDLIGTSRPRVAIPDKSDDPKLAARTERVDIECPKGQGRVEKRIERQVVSETAAYLF